MVDGGETMLKYIGDNLVLIKGLELEKAQNIVNNYEEGVLSLFHTVQQWNLGIVSRNRLA